ncbi:unnamed protein product [Rotaria sp. Silwood1]|nr:unnamed protein product [Rotaria sp. Silwood1]CAF1451509.1 unnamed protein product [Rotaria sp. Silwood1]CAF3622705.1 unnamed protein product [Rotaria sp. Silwood1]CAF3637530.1 unnamed protein product [Rotaria sp. Silwood1]
MATRDATKVIFEQIDTNRDGNIDKNELRTWISNAEELPSASCELATTERNFNDNTITRFDRNKYKGSCENISKYRTDKYTSYETTTVARELMDDTVITTNSSEETNRYIERSPNNIYKDPNPQIIRRAAPDRPVTYEQRIHLKYLQPPALSPPGPLIIKEVRPPQPPPPPPLVIREHASSLSSPSPLILRERPPIPPPCIPSETITRYLPPIPVPPRSVVIERYPPLPEKPRDIIIERWLPYGPQPERRTIVEPAPPPIPYPEPRNKIITYDAVEARTVRKFEHLGPCKRDPADYVAHYGRSLLDPDTLIQQARNANIIEDISPPPPSSSIHVNIRGDIDCDQSNDKINRVFSSSGGTCCERYQLGAGTQTFNRGSTRYASSTSKLMCGSRIQSGFHDGDTTITSVWI